MKRTSVLQIARIAVAVIELAALGACGSPGSVAGSVATSSSGLPLDVGASGDVVRSVNAYLATFGYFPNAGLAQSFPRWRPVVPIAPADPNVYDERTADAVRALQANYGVARTGLVDEATLALVRTARCGDPDGIPVDGTDKYSLLRDTLNLPGTGRWAVPLPGQLNVTYVVGSAPSGLSIADVQGAAAIAFGAWQATMGNQFVFQDGTSPPIRPVQIGINSAASGSGCTAGTSWVGCTEPIYDTSGNFTGAIITLNTAFTFTTTLLPGAAVAAGDYDVASILMHEVGHALGLDHSSNVRMVMYPEARVGSILRTIGIDDNVATRALYQSWIPTSGLARDVGTGGDGTLPAGVPGLPTWVIGTNVVGHGWGVFHFENNSWFMDQNGGVGARIAIGPGNVPWVIDAMGAVSAKPSGDPRTGTWVSRGAPGGAATDIAVAGNTLNSVWAIGPTTFGDGAIYAWEGGSNPTAWDVDTAGGMANKIAVTPGGVPYVVTNAGQVYRKQSGSAFSGFWEELPDPPGVGIRAADIAVNSDGTLTSGLDYVWMTSVDGNVYVWDEQPLLDDGGMNEVAESKWILLPFTTLSGIGAKSGFISVGPGGRPWVVDRNQGIWEGTY